MCNVCVDKLLKSVTGDDIQHDRIVSEPTVRETSRKLLMEIFTDGPEYVAGMVGDFHDTLRECGYANCVRYDVKEGVIVGMANPEDDNTFIPIMTLGSINKLMGLVSSLALAAVVQMMGEPDCE